MTKPPSNVGVKGNLAYSIWQKKHNEQPTINIILNSEILNTLPLTSTSIQHYIILETLSTIIRQEKTGIKIRKKEIEWSLFANDNCLHRKS